MNDANAARIIAAAPRLFPRGFYFECDDGWAGLLERLFVRLAEIAPAGCEAMQVKHKFGSLRVYLGNGDAATDAAVMAAEAEARVTCEECGRPGELRGGGWYRVRCIPCLRAEEDRRPATFRRDPFG